ncbi:hypothetical protein V7122_09425 [Bacillus sp. JJ1532]|uniref:hypothetical protein n=1 Tax=unclassified Bacillus (in: firmicutes) TaxID=185979 RepID=UPI002FFFAD46
MKRSIVILLILMLVVTTQAFASQNDVIKPFNAEGVDSENIKAGQVFTTIEEKSNLKFDGPDATINSLNDDESTNGEPLCWYCTKYAYGGGDGNVPRYKVCIEGFWSNICRAQ